MLYLSNKVLIRYLNPRLRQTRSCKAGDNFGLFMTSNDVALGLGLVVVCLFNVISYNKLESWNKFVLNDLSF